MTMNELKDAAFWGMLVCLDCDAHFDPAGAEQCPNCGSESVVAADKLLGWAERLEEE